MTTYKDYDLFLFEPDWIRTPSLSFQHPIDSLLNAPGKSYFDSSFLETSLSIKALFSSVSRSEAYDLLNFFDNKLGRYDVFWIPSWQKDIIISDAFSASDLTLTIEKELYGNIWYDSFSTGHFLFFKWPDGDFSCRKVVSMPSETQITLEEAIGKDCSTDDLNRLMVSFLFFVRFDQDEIEIEWRTEEFASCELSFKTLPLEALTIE